MDLNKIVVNFVVSCGLILGTVNSYAEKSKYDHIYMRNFTDGSVIEGSSQYGGLQPNYILDTQAEAFSNIWELSDSLKKDKTQTMIEKVEVLIKRVREVFSKHHQYNDPVYLKLMKEYRDKNLEIPLSQYVNCGVGVCREHSLLLHLALKRAGVSNYFVYANVLVDHLGATPVSEDHGFVVFEYENERWIADSYFDQFNGYSFDEFMQNINILRIPNRRLSFAKTRIEPRAIVHLNQYPQAISCRIVMGSSL